MGKMGGNQVTTGFDSLRCRLKLSDSDILRISDLDIDGVIRSYMDRRCAVMRGDEASVPELFAAREDLVYLLSLQIPSVRLSIITGLEKSKVT